MQKIKFSKIKQIVVKDYILTLAGYDDFNDHSIERLKSCKNIEELIETLDITECDATGYILGLLIETE